MKHSEKKSENKYNLGNPDCLPLGLKPLLKRSGEQEKIYQIHRNFIIEKNNIFLFLSTKYITSPHHMCFIDWPI